MSKRTADTTVFQGKTYTLDIHGYLDPPQQWDEDFAVGIAPQVGILGGLNEEHWKLIKYLRRRFTEEQFVPLVLNACIDNKLRLGRLRQLFPSGYHRGACKMAGLNYRFMATNNMLLTYENYTTLKTSYSLTDTGFLENHEDWDERFARYVLSDTDPPIPLTDTHRRIIDFLRKHYERARDIPTIYDTCKSNTIGIGELWDLFPAGYRRGACRAAGLPFFA